MSINRVLLSEIQTAQVKQSANEELSAWSCYRRRRFANFTHEVHDFPNATIYINVGASAGWVEQLAGITNVTVGVASGSGITGRIGVNQIVGTGVFLEGTNRILFGQKALLVPGFLEGFEQGYFAGNTVYASAGAVTLLGNVQQITMVEPVDAAKLVQLAVLQEYSLSAQLRRLRKLQPGWDSDAAPCVSGDTGDTAEEIIKQLLQTALSYSAISTTRLGPLPDGTLRFECTHSNKELFLTISDKAIEIQAWQPLDAVESVGYWRTDTTGAREHLEWLVK